MHATLSSNLAGYEGAPCRDVTVGWTAVVLAGQRPGVDPVAAHFGMRTKSLVPVRGEPMLLRVLRTLLHTPGIAKVLVLAQDIDEQMTHPALLALRSDLRVVACRSGATISGSVLDAIGRGDIQWPVLVTTADNVMLTPETTHEFMRGLTGQDVAIGLVERSRLEAACGPSTRTWLRFGDGAFTGANLFALRSVRVAPLLRFWETAEHDRKSMLKLAARFGPVLLLKILLRRLTLHAALTAAGQRLGLDVSPVLLTDGRTGVDVDKPEDHALVERLLAEQAGTSASDMAGCPVTLPGMPA
ncbi:NTP transferase domain-containing protein [Blastomonas sp.]|uniref:NTP transferase domain-containing protein n=1 Tax=Blastomonas sp. TaxID=1909299 RepID=UPI002625A20B|nr:NTP transferase domain-containing protein [Blastomonas sp.]MDM7957023.1 NTP transferase domain-containing protein [Blastomonas sp.]